MALNRGLLCVLGVLLAVTAVESWSGHYCSWSWCQYRLVRSCCRRGWWNKCTSWRHYRVCDRRTSYDCCWGWSHNGNENCNIPVCTPPCKNGGRCLQPGICTCPSTHTGDRCGDAVCSYRSPCYPGSCYGYDSCDCSSGFTTAPATSSSSYKQNYCLKIEDNSQVDLRLTEMQVRMSYWPRHTNPPIQQHWIMADSTNRSTMDVLWTNRRDFNRLETTSTTYYNPPKLTDHPRYVRNSGFGIVDAKIQVWLKKLLPGGNVAEHTSLNKTIPCNNPVSSTRPYTGIYNCSVEDANFDRFLEHRDALKFTFHSTGGGYRRLVYPNSGAHYSTQSYEGVSRQLAVEFRFDFLLPEHCELNRSCTADEVALSVPDLTRTSHISIKWKGWTDADSGMFRYAWEVFRMTKTIDGGLTIRDTVALSPLINTEVMAANYTPQSYVLPGPGMYSVILEAGDAANNTLYVRRLVLYDPDPKITSDPDHDLFVSTASQAAGYKYQNDLNGDITVTWDRHFRNALHEDDNLLGSVRRYPVELRDGVTTEGAPRFRKVIPLGSNQDDHEGDRTVDAIPNERGIVSFAVQYDKDSGGGLNQPLVPSGTWTDLQLNTSFTLSPQILSQAMTVTVWVKATDVMGSEKVERTQVTFDNTRPDISQGIQFRMNVPVPGIDFSSQFTVETRDLQSGIAFIVWTFTRLSNNSVIYQQTVQGARVPTCTGFKVCDCTTRKDECFSHTQVFSVSNCHMMVEKESLNTETINVTADVTNMAGLVTTVSMLKDDLTKLNGTEAYYPPQNIIVSDITVDSVTLTWSFPPSCFPRTAVWVMVNQERRPVHRDARQFTVTGLEAGQEHQVYLVTEYDGSVKSDRVVVRFVTTRCCPL